MSSKIVNKTEKEEKTYLESIKNKLQQAINQTDDAMAGHAKEVQESKDYLWENKAGMDHVEKVAVRQSITQIALTGENARERKKRLAKLINSPYFGRIDFAENRDKTPRPLYIGIHSYLDQKENINLIHDWRAPISTMFYDFELGQAHYQAPSGRIEGQITNKRQYRIRGGKMEFMLESSLNIHDDVLQKELSQNSSDKMKNIVATIQRDQNAIIRNENAQELIIQGVAGSGKTSIALHRVAFLLYRFKDSIKSEDILILSPNKVFADYISNVLPELGEEKIQEAGMEELAAEILEDKYKFQTFFEQVAQLLAKNDEKFRQRINFKSGFDIINLLNQFVVHIENEYFKPVDFIVKRYPVPATYLAEKFVTYQRLPVLKRIPQMVIDIANDLSFYNRYEVSAAEKNQIRKEIEKMFKDTNLRKIYKDFYQWLGKPEMMKQAKGSVYEYSDVFPLIYLKTKLEGIKSYNHIKHLVIDEMQDYTPLQYSILAKLFPCNKTILGDSNQSVNPYSSSNSEVINKIFPAALSLKMTKSYRSTYEITDFAQRIRYNPDIELIERHGETPKVLKMSSEQAENEAILDLIRQFKQSDATSLGIICKTQPQADILYQKIGDQHRQIFVLNTQSTSFSEGIIISTAHLAKGLEFDQVIVPHCDSKNYKTETDRQMLYIACTRAMHRLNLTHTGRVSDFLSGERK